MHLYKLERRFNSKTGKEISPIPTECGFICDFTGRLLDDFRPSSYTIKVDYDCSCEQSWEYDDGREAFEEKYKYDYGSLVKQDYHFADNGQGQDVSCNMLVEWYKGFDIKGDIFYQCLSIEEALKRSRYRTVCKLLDDKTYTGEQLGLEVID